MPQTPLVLATTLPGTNLIRSFDGISYAAFTPAAGPTSFRALLAAGVGPVIYAIDGGAQLWQSFDFGVTWFAFGVPAPNGVVNAANQFYRTPAGTWLVPNGVVNDTAQIQRSITNGASWTTVRPSGVIADNYVIRAFFSASSFLSGFSGPIGATIWFALDDNTDTTKSGLWRSADDGLTWAHVANTSTAATTGTQLLRSAFFIAFSSILQRNPLPSTNPQTQFAYAPSTNPDSNVSIVTRGDAGGAFLVEGTDGIVRSWSSGGDEFHATEANVDANAWTAGPLAVANAPSYGAVVVKGDQFFGANIALAHWVSSQNHGGAWADTGLSIGPGQLSVIVVTAFPQFPGTGSAQDPGEFLTYGSIARGQMSGM